MWPQPPIVPFIHSKPVVCPLVAALGYCADVGRCYQVYCFRALLGAVIAPCFTPQPVLRQRLDGHLVDHVVGQILDKETNSEKSWDVTSIGEYAEY